MSEPFEITPMLRNEIAAGERERGPADRRAVRPADDAPQHSPGVDRGWGGDRQDDDRGREGAPAGPRGLPDAARLLQLSPRRDARRRRSPRPPTRPACSRSGRSTSCARTSGARPASSAPGRRRCASLVRRDPAAGARRRDRQARPALPRDRGRRGPGLRPPAGCSRSRALLFAGREDVLYVFHDPAQALFREDAVAGLGMPEFALTMNCRNAQPIHALIQRFAGEGLSANALRHDGRRPELIEADGPQATIRALQAVLHRLRVDEGVKPWDIAVLTGAPARGLGRLARARPPVRQRGPGQSRGRRRGPQPRAGRAPTSRSCPRDVILCDTIRRFKGLERPVIILVELSTERREDARPAALRRRLEGAAAPRRDRHERSPGPAAVVRDSAVRSPNVDRDALAAVVDREGETRNGSERGRRVGVSWARSASLVGPGTCRFVRSLRTQPHHTRGQLRWPTGIQPHSPRG